MREDERMAQQADHLPAIRPVERADVATQDFAPALIPSWAELDIISRIGSWAEKSGNFKGLTAEGCAIKILAGREYNVGPWQALSGIHIINGVASLSANLIGGLVTRFLRKQRGGEFRVVVNTAAECTVRYRRPEWDESSEITWTIEEAKQAKLVKTDSNWEKYPRAMLRNRAVAEAARTGFPDICAGLYDPDEIEAGDVHVVTLGDVDAIAKVAPPSRPAEPIDVAGADLPASRPGKRSGVVQPDGRVVDRNTGEIIQEANTDAMQERTSTAIQNQFKHLGMTLDDLNDLIVTEFNIPDAADMKELDGLFLTKLLTYARHIQGAMVTSRLDKIVADMEADPERERVIDSAWLSQRFAAKQAELEAKVAASSSGGR